MLFRSALTATAFDAVTNNTIDATHHAYWQGAQDANGTLNAFTVVAKDNGGLESASPVQVQMSVTAVNDAPAATDDALSSVAEDSGMRVISFAALLGNDADGDPEVAQTLTITALSNVVGGTAVINEIGRAHV